MKNNSKKSEKNNFTKLTRAGISLIVLVITIILIIILASAVILSISSNNPVKEANIARYESDCANMQSLLTNTVAKIMAKNKGIVEIKYGKINEIEEGKKEVVGEITYSVVDAQNIENANGKIIFDSGNNTETEFYVGKKLPIYSAGNTKWYVDNEGKIALNVKEEIYGVGDIIDVNNITMVEGNIFKDIVPDTATSVIFTDEKAPYGYTIDTGELIDVSQNGSSGVVAWSDGTTFKISTQKSNVSAIANDNCSNMFNGKTNLQKIEFLYLDTSNTTNMSYMFQNCSSIVSLDLRVLETSKVTSMRNMFRDCSNLKDLNISKFDTSEVKSMYEMFRSCGFETVDVSSFDTSKVTDMTSMFIYCPNLAKLDLSNFDTPNLTSMTYMFYSDSKLSTLNVSSFDTSNVKNFAYIFHGCKSLKEIDVSTWNTANVNNFTHTFSGCSSLTNLDLSNFDTSSATSMHNMFSWCTSLKELNVSSFDTSKVTDMTNFVQNCYSLKVLDFSTFDISNVVQMSGIFTWTSGIINAYARTQEDADKFNSVIPGDFSWLFKPKYFEVDITLDNKYSDVVSITVPEKVYGDLTKLTLVPVDTTKKVISFKINGALIESNIFVVPKEGGIISITDVILE